MRKPFIPGSRVEFATVEEGYALLKQWRDAVGCDAANPLGMEGMSKQFYSCYPLLRSERSWLHSDWPIFWSQKAIFNIEYLSEGRGMTFVQKKVYFF
ncbi:MAG: hypothetical protein AUF79_01220 [Crenarchaeota archaeon 13_1_20CM_2_51_8]|nr:MAG: hypothetical protein AUF79_01220 [Crenarchaeota archaeon 13_1_20CM_2_51_8]